MTRTTKHMRKIIASRLKRGLLDLLRSRRGVAVVEFALLAPVLLIAVMGLASFGLVVFQKMQLNSAAHAGAQLALVDASSTSAIENAVLASTSLPITVDNVTTEEFCECADGTTITCGNVCTDASDNRYFMSITVTMDADLLFWNGVVALSQTATVRTE